jgi:integration host factor subunit beta
MNKFDLIKRMSTEADLSMTKAEEVVNLIFKSMADTLANDERVEIRGFGSFKAKHYDGFQGRNPKTGEVVNVKPKKLPVFKCGKELKERVDF